MLESNPLANIASFLHRAEDDLEKTDAVTPELYMCLVAAERTIRAMHRDYAEVIRFLDELVLPQLEGLRSEYRKRKSGQSKSGGLQIARHIHSDLQDAALGLGRHGEDLFLGERARP